MERSITLGSEVKATPERVFEILTTSSGQASFWTDNCDVSTKKARFGFDPAPVDLKVTVTAQPAKLVRMKVDSGFPFWEGSTWEWELSDAANIESGTNVLFRHYGFGEGHGENDLGHTAQSWAMILARLTNFIETDQPQPFFVHAPQ